MKIANAYVICTYRYQNGTYQRDIIDEFDDINDAIEKASRLEKSTGVTPQIEIIQRLQKE